MGLSRAFAPLLVLGCATSGVLAGKKAFNIQDDLLAFPQFRVNFPDEYVLDSQAKELLQSQTDTFDSQGQKHAQVALGKREGSNQPQGSEALTYEEMILEGQRYLCQIPFVDTDDRNGTRQAEPTEAEERKELARATDRGLELLREMEGKCMYYVSGWWSYSFCYKKQIRQFHALPLGSGIPNYPPMEDPTTHSFVLGKFPRDNDEVDEAERRTTTTDVAELQTKGGSRYLVQRLRGGTKCDLTGRDRKIEIQFHCNPQSTDRIGWIKELTTCSYLMVIYTPRLCNDVAFLPPQQEEVYTVECREILTPQEVPEWEAMQQYLSSQQLVEAAESSDFAIVGDIAVGAQKLVGKEGKRLEKGRVASAGEERVEVVAKSENGEVHRLSKEELKKFDLDPEKVETLKKQIEEIANGKDWTLEVVEANRERRLRGVVDADEEKGGDDESYESHEAHDDRQKDTKGSKQETGKHQHKEQPQPKEPKKGQESKEPVPESEEGSKETFKDEL